MKNCKAGLTLALLLLAVPAHALTIEAASVTGSDPVTFSVTFNAVPDLSGSDEFGWWVTTSLTANPFADPQVVLRSGFVPDGVLVNGGPGLDSLAVLPYSLAGRTVSFVAPASMFGDAQVRWRLGLVVNGALVDDDEGFGGLVDPHAVYVPTHRTSWGRVKALYAGR